VAWWIVSATFDPDLYRIWRLMASDIVFAAVLVGLALALPGLADARSAPPSPLRRGDLRSGTVRRT
ncbi:MAG TPA: hypothetical protein VFW92_05220, partial [Candidatus Limnocylindrales bacterium]|nr:hypothetical protein [Candidatus Limnocylindrales bacterium]